MTVDAHAEVLYGGDPTTFVARRDELSRDLRAAGQRAEATAVKALRRPTAPAAALNAVSRDAPHLIADAVEAADVLTRTQRRALSGLAGADVRGAVRAHHATIAAVIDAAGGQPVAVADAMRATLLAAAVDSQVADRLRRGVLATAAAQADTSAALLLSTPLTAVADQSPPPERTRDAGSGPGRPESGRPERPEPGHDEADRDEPGDGNPDDDAVAAANAMRLAAEAKLVREAAARREAATEALTRAERQLGTARAEQVATARKRRTAVATAEAAAGEAVTAARAVERLGRELARAETARTTADAVQEEAEALLGTAAERDDDATHAVQLAQQALEEAAEALAGLPAPP